MNDAPFLAGHSTEIRFPKSMLSVSNYVFQDCSGLKNIFIYSAINLGNAFDSCTALENVYCYSNNISFSISTFGSLPTTRLKNITFHGYEGSTAQTFG